MAVTHTIERTALELEVAGGDDDGEDAGSEADTVSEPVDAGTDDSAQENEDGE